MLLLLAFANEQDKEKFEMLYSKYKNLMLYKAHQILHDYALAEDAVSEAYLRIYKNIHKIEDPLSNKSIAFCVTIAKNVALTLLDKEKKRTVEPFEDDFQDDFNLEQHVFSQIQADKIYSLIDGIDEECRHVFLLRFAYEMSNKEIGEILSISENHVSVRLYRAKKKLTKLLEMEGYLHEKQG